MTVDLRHFPLILSELFPTMPGSRLASIRKQAISLELLASSSHFSSCISSQSKGFFEALAQ